MRFAPSIHQDCQWTAKASQLHGIPAWTGQSLGIERSGVGAFVIEGKPITNMSKHKPWLYFSFVPLISRNAVVKSMALALTEMLQWEKYIIWFFSRKGLSTLVSIWLRLLKNVFDLVRRCIIIQAFGKRIRKWQINTKHKQHWDET